MMLLKFNKIIILVKIQIQALQVVNKRQVVAVGMQFLLNDNYQIWVAVVVRVVINVVEIIIIEMVEIIMVLQVTVDNDQIIMIGIQIDRTIQEMEDNLMI